MRRTKAIALKLAMRVSEETGAVMVIYKEHSSGHWKYCGYVHWLKQQMEGHYTSYEVVGAGEATRKLMQEIEDRKFELEEMREKKALRARLEAEQKSGIRTPETWLPKPTRKTTAVDIEELMKDIP